MSISTLNCEMWPNFSYRGVRPFQLSLLLLLLMVFSSENFGFSPPYAGIAGIGPVAYHMAINLTSCPPHFLKAGAAPGVGCFSPGNCLLIFSFSGKTHG